MAKKILGIDLGTSSIGISLRNPDIRGSITEQLDYYSVDVFKSGVGGEGKSYAAVRTEARQPRRLYDARRRRLWATLKLLIDENLCPMSMESLDSWRKYDKTRGGYSHQYPVDDAVFEKWIKMDFDGDGKPDFKTPYHLRKRLIEIQLDKDNLMHRYMLGRAFYHIAQRRGFKSSKGSKADASGDSDNSTEEIEAALSEELKASETKINGKLDNYMRENGCATVGCAFAELIDKGVRIRASEYQAVRKDYINEINEIFRRQEQLSIDSKLYQRLMSQDKKDGTIFYKKKLAGQKGNVGKCTLEKSKARCPVSHPVFEEFRALSFINNVRYRKDSDEEWSNLSPEIVDKIYKSLFISSISKSKKIKFKDIRLLLEKEIGLSLSKEKGTINYSDTLTVAGCPVTARLIRLFGENWKEFSWEGKKQRMNQAKEGKTFHTVRHTAESVWNYCFTADDPEELERYATDCLGWEVKQTKQLLQLWDDMQQGYSMLSQKAMKNIIRFLRLGLRYSDAVMLAKIPDLLEKYGLNIDGDVLQTIIHDYTYSIKKHNDNLKTYAAITNNLISNYKGLTYNERNDDWLEEHTLNDRDFENISERCKGYFGARKWDSMSHDEKETVKREVADRYQNFFRDKNRDYVRAPKLADAVFAYLKELCPALNDADKDKLYHPSMVSVYRPVNSSDSDTPILLGAPNMGSIKNPVALRTLNILREKINKMLTCHLIDPDDTRIVIETTRRKGDVLDDANMRKAFEHYQKERGNERAEIKKILSEEYPNREIGYKDIDKALYVIEQIKHADMQTPYLRNEGKNKGTFDRTFSKYILRYRLWLEQGCRCLYTGNTINIKNLFDPNATDIEHTIPRSLCFDDSDANLTVCDAYYNRNIKNNRIPTQLENYEEDANGYSAIKPRLEQWEKKVEHLEEMVDFWKHKSRRAQTKEDKDYAIVCKHEWQMELDYWRNKLDRFTRTDIPEGFRNSQLVDTGIITRHALAYLKSVFRNVVAEKGSVTAVFRKILKLQSLEESEGENKKDANKKDRSSHSHHAIDAMVLTVIPMAGMREEMLKLYYQREESEKLGQLEWVRYYDNLLNDKISQLDLGGGFETLKDFINENLLVNHHQKKDRTLKTAKRIKRVRGKVVFQKDRQGRYKKDADGNNIPEYSNGDSIRLEISAKSNLGAIVLPDKDANGQFVKENGRYRYAMKNGHYNYTMVMRVDIKSFKELKDLDKIIDPIVRQSILTTVSLCNKSEKKKASLASILSNGVWIRDKKGTGKEIKKDKNDQPIPPIRHVRCKVVSGKGFLNFETSIPLREQKYVSSKPLYNLENRNHKNYVYAQNTENYLCLIYEGIYGGKLYREFEFISAYDTAKLVHTYRHLDEVELSNFKQFSDKLKTEPAFQKRVFKKKEYSLTAIIRRGDYVLKRENPAEELHELSRVELLKRLYVVEKFNNAGTNYIYLRSHLDAKPNSWEKISSSNFNYMIEHRDFEIRLTEQGDQIEFK